MMRNVLSRLHKSEKGFTLFELLIAMAIGMLISGGITATIFQVVNTNARSTNHMIAVRETQNIGYWISRDAQMAQNPYDDILQTPPGFLSFRWTEWNGKKLEVTYSFSGTTLVRSEVQTIEDIEQPASSLTLAEHFDAGASSCSFDTSTNMLTMTVTATVGSPSQQVSETREYQIKPRPSS